jgi:predicted  nucleic acid-binding Zn-ribbon protein
MCTRCNNVFTGDEDILKGCPVCGWKKFLFVRSGKEIRSPDLTQKETEELLITQAMGVRVPPRREAKKETQAPPEEAREAEEDKVESIKITAPGTYELNLPSLFERQELIMAVKDGTYLIDLSSAFRKSKRE